MNKSPIGKVMDCLFFAPFGVAVTVIETLPNASQKGKDKINSQIASARFVGAFAVKQSQGQIQKLLNQTIGQIGAFGGLGRPSDSSLDISDPQSNGESLDSNLRPDASESIELGITSYDNLSASQIVQRLGGLSASELEAIRDHELSHRNRRTILVRIDQLSPRTPD